MSNIELEMSSLRAPAAMMIAAGVVLPLVGHPGVACPLRSATGIPCPLCGLSTSVQETVRGDVSAAVAANPVGLLLVVVALWVLVARPRQGVTLSPLVLAVAGVGSWLFQLYRYSVL